MNKDRMVKKPNHIAEGFLDISSATLDEVMGKGHTLSPSVRPLWRPLSLCGPAFTVQAFAGDNLAAHWALAVAPAGSVLVITHNGDTEHGGWGEIMSTAALKRGIRGLVTDGAVRDTVACQRLNFPIFSGGISIKGTGKTMPGAVNVPIVCAGILIHPGDIVVADDDGVVVVPADMAAGTLEKARRHDAEEARLIEQIQEAQLTVDLLNLRSKLPALNET